MSLDSISMHETVVCWIYLCDNNPGHFRVPKLLPGAKILTCFHGQCQIKANGKRWSCFVLQWITTIAVPDVHSSTNTCTSYLEHPIFQLILTLCATYGLATCGGDSKDTFAHLSDPLKLIFMKIDHFLLWIGIQNKLGHWGLSKIKPRLFPGALVIKWYSICKYLRETPLNQRRV